MLCSCGMLGSLTGLLAMVLLTQPTAAALRVLERERHLHDLNCGQPGGFICSPDVPLLLSFMSFLLGSFHNSQRVLWRGVRALGTSGLESSSNSTQGLWQPGEKNAFLHAQGWPAVAASTSLTHLEVRTQAAGTEVNKCFLEWKGHPVCC